MSYIIKFTSVSKKFRQTIALNNLSFKIKYKEFIGVIGNNGCGKTTTIHCLCNISKYDKGSIEIFNQNIKPQNVTYKNKLGVVLSKPYFIEEFNIIEYLKFVCKFQYVPKTEINSRINDLLELFDLKDEKNKVIKNLSSGNQMKVSLSSALIHNPELLVLDEPFVNIDIQTTEKFINILKLFKGKKTLFITSHNLDLVADLCDRFLIMDKGKIVMDVKKSDYESIEHLKTEIKQKITRNTNFENLSWLT
jgi:ABC-type multidrug transport system ATPase subunit